MAGKHHAPGDAPVKLSGMKAATAKPRAYAADAMRGSADLGLAENVHDVEVKITLRDIRDMFADNGALRRVFLRWRQGFSIPTEVTFRQLTNSHNPTFEVTRTTRLLGLLPVKTSCRVDRDGHRLT